MKLNKLIFINLLAGTTAAFASFSITGSASNSQIRLTWDSQVNHGYTIMLSTNLVDGYTEFTTVQSTPPLNTWWEDLGHDVGFYAVSRPAVTNTPATPPATTNLIVNGDFSSGLDSWTQSTGGGTADAAISVSNGVVHVDITDGSTDQFHIFMRQFDIPMENGTNYTIQFDARADAPRSIRVISQDASGSPVHKSQNISLSTSMAHYSIPFTMSNPSNPTNRMHFGFGGDDNSVWLDHVELTYSLGGGSAGAPRAVAHEFNRRMGRGNNFMAAKSMNGQGALEDYILLNESYFHHCRIGYKMDLVAGSAPNYTIPPANMTALQNMVDWCLSQGLIANIDPVHNWANDSGDAQYDPDDLDKLSNIWVQVASHFSAYDLENVVFEIMNEPHGEDNVAEIIQTCLAAIRGTAGNETRIVIVPGDGFSTRQALIDALDNDEIPADDDYLIGTFHYYDPKTFTKQGASNITWGTAGEFTQVISDFDAVLTANTDWAVRNGTTPLPIYLGEFGCDNGAPTADRKRWLSWIRLQAETRGMSWAHWNMYANEDNNKGMGPWTTYVINNPEQRYFDTDPVEALIGRYEFEDGSKGGGVVYDNTYAGFTGTGYADFPATNGTAYWARIDGIYIPTNGTYTVQIHYASDVARDLRLVSRNDSAVTVQTLSNQTFPATGGFDSWKAIEIPVNFEAGEMADLKVVATPDEGVSLDWLRITK